MVQINKKVLILLVVVSLLAGAAGVVLAASAGLGGTLLLTGEDITAYNEQLEKYDKLEFLRSFLTENYYTQINEGLFEDGIYKGLYSSIGDPYTEYVPASESESYNQQLTGNYSGIGIAYFANEDEYAEISSVNKDGPADKAGMRVGDLIVKVNDEDVAKVNVDYIATLVKGPEGTSVKVTVLRDGKEIEFEMVRANIISQSVDYEILDNNIGHIVISHFEMDTTNQFKDCLKAVEEANVDGLVIDLRDNGGGLVESAIEIADLLMNKGTVVTIKDKNANAQTYTTEDGRTKLSYVLLVNGNSASASEILTAGIKENHEGLVVGTKTFGKGIMQTVYNLTDGSMVKITEYQYFSPAGNVIHQVGITPDYVVEFTDDCFDEDGYLVNDIQLEKAIEVLKENR